MGVLMKRVPDHNGDGIIPPYSAADPAVPGSRSPYSTEWDEVIQRFATSDRRVEILLGLVAYREAIRGIGIVDGFQWLTGSFVEQIPREPGDVDVVTFFHVPPGLDSTAARPLFDSRCAKAQYHCDAYPVPLSYPPGPNAPSHTQAVVSLVDQTTYWYGLFSHRRITSAWKGFVQLPLTSGEKDAAARDMLLALRAEKQRKAG
ncbi:hypothetical protein LXT21_44135 [Myxococcus sp. K38C18041901]|uniref:DUF6932 family protein n=1 Tax=Myxococcus guangdongensis TaxID=2906760 RepID=UPI0020A757FD|nr:hypothetical protein [Myxococcus guangdongensis]MCP3065779.1 hypothetical protein [Myxococcus guangdongensis]